MKDGDEWKAAFHTNHVNFTLPHLVHVESKPSAWSPSSVLARASPTYYSDMIFKLSLNIIVLYIILIFFLLLFGKVVTRSGKARQKRLSFVRVLLVMSDSANFHEICTAARYSGSLFIILSLNICITIILITILSSPLTHNLYSELMTPTSHYAYPPTSYLPYHMPVLYYYYHHLVSYHPKILYFLRKCG